jgi:hypothetical protein
MGCPAFHAAFFLFYSAGLPLLCLAVWPIGLRTMMILLATQLLFLQQCARVPTQLHSTAMPCKACLHVKVRQTGV